MRVLLVIILSFVCLPLHAGTVNVTNGKGAWQSTGCVRPMPLSFVGMGSEAPAASINRATGSFNAFVQRTQEYMDCLAREAKADADATNSIIMTALDRQMQDAQEEVNRARAQLFGKPAQR